MAETLGSLCDKLTIVKLKQYHADNDKKIENLLVQEIQLQSEIDLFIKNAAIGIIPNDRLVCASHKIYKRQGNIISKISGSIGKIISILADTNCKLWHEQEKVYDFENVPLTEKNSVVKNIAILNLERNNCIEKIDVVFKRMMQGVKRNNENHAKRMRSMQRRQGCI